MELLKSALKKIRNIIVTLYSVFLIVFIVLFKQKKCLLVTNGLGYGGAPLVLMNTIEFFVNEGYKVVVFSNYFGPLSKMILKKGGEVVIIPYQFELIYKIILKINWEFVFVNTIVEYKWINLLNNGNTTTYWWIHESDTYVNEVAAKIPQKLSDNIKVFAVSSRTNNALILNGINYKTNLLPYGIDDMSSCLSEDNIFKLDTKYKYILIVGAICNRKNQLFAIDTFEVFQNEIQDTVKLIIVGKGIEGEETYERVVMERIKDNADIIYYDVLNRIEIHKLIKLVDVVLCCSKDDPLPVIVSEALMHGKNVVVNRNVGQYELIQKYDAGYVYDDKDDLINILEELVLIKEYNSAARDLYENYFSTESFKYNLIKFIK